MQALTFQDTAIELFTRRHEILHLTFVQLFSVERRSVLPYKIRTRAYHYMLEDEHRSEILGFHWHPESTPDIQFPHLHICGAAARDLRSEIRDIHFKTDRIAFEEFGLMLLRHFEVEPERNDAESLLMRNLDLFKRYRSWASH
jgi:hypothetical protein